MASIRRFIARKSLSKTAPTKVDNASTPVRPLQTSGIQHPSEHTKSQPPAHPLPKQREVGNSEKPSKGPERPSNPSTQNLRTRNQNNKGTSNSPVGKNVVQPERRRLLERSRLEEMKPGNKRRLSSRPVAGQVTKARRLESNGSVSNGNEPTVRRTQNPPSTSPSERRDDMEQFREQQQSPPKERFELTGLPPSDIEAVTMLISEAEHRISRSVISANKKVITEVKQQESVISGMVNTLSSIERTLSSLKTLTVQNSTAIARSHSPGTSSKSKRKNGKTSFEDEIEGKYPTIKIEMKAVFESVILCRAAVHNISTYMDFFHEKQDNVRMSAKIMKVFLYGLKKKLTMIELKHGIRKQTANFRHKVVKVAVRNALTISDDHFRRQQEQAIAELIREGDGSSDLIASMQHISAKPTWLIPELLTSQMISMARKQHDCVMSEWDPIPRSANDRKALYICRHLFKTVIDMLRRSRDRCKQRMFAAGLCFIADWTGSKHFKLGHCNPNAVFIHLSETPISPKEIEDCKLYNHPEHVQHNAGLLKQMIAERKEMFIEATYNVTVVVSRGSRTVNEESENEEDIGKERVTELREIRRHISIIGIAVAFMEGYTHSTQNEILSVHPSMLRNIYRVALLLREFFIERMDEENRPPSAQVSTEQANTDNRDDSSARSNTPIVDRTTPVIGTTNSRSAATSAAHGTSGADTERGNRATMIPEARLSDMLSPSSEVDKVLSKMLNITVETFEKIRVKDVNEVSSQQPEQEEGNNGPQGLDSDDEEDVDGMLED